MSRRRGETVRSLLWAVCACACVCVCVRVSASAACKQKGQLSFNKLAKWRGLPPASGRAAAAPTTAAP